MGLVPVVLVGYENRGGIFGGNDVGNFADTNAPRVRALKFGADIVETLAVSANMQTPRKTLAALGKLGAPARAAGFIRAESHGDIVDGKTAFAHKTQRQRARHGFVVGVRGKNKSFAVQPEILRGACFFESFGIGRKGVGERRGAHRRRAEGDFLRFGKEGGELLEIFEIVIHFAANV